MFWNNSHSDGQADYYARGIEGLVTLLKHKGAWLFDDYLTFPTQVLYKSCQLMYHAKLLYLPSQHYIVKTQDFAW